MRAEQRENAVRAYRTEMEASKQEGLEKGHKAGLKEGLEKGRKEGIETGKHNEKIEMAKKLLKRKLSIEDIVDITGLSIDKIKGLK